MRKFWLLIVVSVAVQFLSGQTQENKREKYDPPSRGDASIQSHREGFFSFVMKAVNPKDIDFGELIAERRRTLADASVTNPYFWYGAGSTIAILVLLFALYVKILEGNSFMWRSAEVITDLRNSETLAIAKAKEAIVRYNRHMSDCNRVIEAGIAGRPLPGTVLGQDMERTVYSLRQELDASTEENRRLRQQLQEKETLIRDMTKRMDVLEQADPSALQAPVNSSESISELMTVINRMARELDAEKRRNGALKGA